MPCKNGIMHKTASQTRLRGGCKDFDRLRGGHTVYSGATRPMCCGVSDVARVRDPARRSIGRPRLRDLLWLRVELSLNHHRATSNSVLRLAKCLQDCEQVGARFASASDKEALLVCGSNRVSATSLIYARASFCA